MDIRGKHFIKKLTATVRLKQRKMKILHFIVKIHEFVNITLFYLILTAKDKDQPNHGIHIGSNMYIYLWSISIEYHRNFAKTISFGKVHKIPVFSPRRNRSSFVILQVFALYSMARQNVCFWRWCRKNNSLDKLKIMSQKLRHLKYVFQD